MKIIKPKEEKGVLFRTLKVGDVFGWGGQVYIKMVSGRAINALDLETGHGIFFYETVEIVPYVGQLRLKKKI